MGKKRTEIIFFFFLKIKEILFGRFKGNEGQLGRKVISKGKGIFDSNECKINSIESTYVSAKAKSRFFCMILRVVSLKVVRKTFTWENNIF